jgi:nicotinate-nucleotide pyrophosphorylase (carboxylating)
LSLPSAFLRHPSTQALIAVALKEDLGSGDLTTRLTVPASARATAVLEAREAGVMAGGPLIAQVYSRLGRVRVQGLLPDGRRFKAGQVLARLSGPARALLTGERVMLNLLQRMSAIATQTEAYVTAAKKKNRRVAVLDTRKTTPGLRRLEKYAVACGGGTNHRLRLDDAVLIKDNHLKAAGSVHAAVNAARRGGKAVEVEVEDLVELNAALDAGADRVLLDNFDLARLKSALREVKAYNAARKRRVLTEASGGVSLKTIGAIAATGVDSISVGALTHSVRALDLSLEFTLA